MAISTITNTATGTEIATAVNALIALVEHATSGNAALSAKVNSTTMGNAALKTKMDELYDVLALPSESEAAAPAELEIPAGEIEVTISAVARTFTFNVASFTYNKTNYVASTLVTTLSNNANSGYADAVALITALVAAGSVIIDGEGSGILTETTE